MTIDIETYLSERVDNQINWHDRKSSKNQKWFKSLQMISLACAAAIPFISGLVIDPTLLRVLVGGLGVVIAVVAGAISLYQFQQHWIDYRVTAEALRGEKYRFVTRTPPYDGPTAFRDFVQTVETILSEQNAKWQANRTAAVEEDEEEPTPEDGG